MKKQTDIQAAGYCFNKDKEVKTREDYIYHENSWQMGHLANFLDFGCSNMWKMKYRKTYKTKYSVSIFTAK